MGLKSVSSSRIECSTLTSSTASRQLNYFLGVVGTRLYILGFLPPTLEHTEFKLALAVWYKPGKIPLPLRDYDAYK